jgi:hypothetical protein
MPGFETLLITFITGVITGKGVMFIYMKIYYNRSLKDRRKNNNLI